LKAGKMFLPYGLQIQDDNAFIRGGRNGSATTGFSFFVSQPAFQIGWEPDTYSIVAAVSQGAVNDTDVQLSGTASALFTERPWCATCWAVRTRMRAAADTSLIGLNLDRIGRCLPGRWISATTTCRSRAAAARASARS
jgi:hypothetical protein